MGRAAYIRRRLVLMAFVLFGVTIVIFGMVRILPGDPAFLILGDRATDQKAAELREQLETAVSAADLSVLERDGYLSLDVKADGFRGVLATRVLAISPFMAIVPRHDVRVPFTDRSGQWLE